MGLALVDSIEMLKHSEVIHLAQGVKNLLLKEEDLSLEVGSPPES